MVSPSEILSVFLNLTHRYKMYLWKEILGKLNFLNIQVSGGNVYEHFDRSDISPKHELVNFRFLDVSLLVRGRIGGKVWWISGFL